MHTGQMAAMVQIIVWIDTVIYYGEMCHIPPNITCNMGFDNLSTENIF